jgi:hypothetical protein
MVDILAIRGLLGENKSDGESRNSSVVFLYLPHYLDTKFEVRRTLFWPLYAKQRCVFMISFRICLCSLIWTLVISRTVLLE